ncbi:DUF7289 family protein [Halobaculum roseum]|uniref:DUF7305 domain-containing protein n=1 Tax=Halobaculum roseum TaxID=2175149 RepID=A0ABD5MPG4_9EURY|nr:hypothetical protein [Halobaculum roseum]QZY02781.1 hypothetical protein K6T36_00855 [Halobaculum roseum]
MPSWGDDDRRAQGDVISVVLLLAITIAGATTVVALGGDAIGGVQQSATTGAAEQSMTQLDSKASLVAHGESDTQRVRLAGSADATRRIDADAGWMNISVYNASTGDFEYEITNTTLGAVVYRDGDTSVAYQGGGVWRRSGNGSSMVSPPEFHYRGTTLTLPLVSVGGDERLDGEVVVRRSSDPAAVYPDGDSDRANPLDEGVVVITVGSEYYDAWGRFFEQRTSGDVTVYHGNRTARTELVVPFETEFDNVVASTSAGGISANPGPPPEPYRDGVVQPSADDVIESHIEECETEPDACINETESDFDTDDMDGGETYFLDGDYGGDLSIDTSDGNVSVVVDGDFDAGDVDVTGGNSTTWYVREDFSVSGDVNPDGPASQLRVLVHSDGDVSFDGNYLFVGFVYAPGSDVDLNGGGGPGTNFEGGLVGDTIDVNGQPNDFEYDESVGTIDLDVSASNAPRITYLHVSVTEIEVDED